MNAQHVIDTELTPPPALDGELSLYRWRKMSLSEAGWHAPTHPASSSSLGHKHLKFRNTLTLIFYISFLFLSASQGNNLFTLTEFLMSVLLVCYVIILSLLQNDIMTAKPQLINKIIISFVSHWTLIPCCSSQTTVPHAAWVNLHEELPDFVRRFLFSMNDLCSNSSFFK